MRSLLSIVLLLLLFLSAGCGAQNSPSRKPLPQAGQSEAQVQTDPALAEKAKTIEGVEDSTALVLDNQIFIGIKVKGFNRFHLKSIKEKTHKKIKEANQGYEVNVTSDKKLFSQLQQIEKQVKENRVESRADIIERIEKINKDMQG